MLILVIQGPRFLTYNARLGDLLAKPGQLQNLRPIKGDRRLHFKGMVISEFMI